MNARRWRKTTPAAARGRFLPVIAALIASLTVLAAPPPASSDWLILRGGAAVETAGPWRVEGRLLVFDRPDGGLASVRLDDVLLPASDRATAAARAALEALPPVAPPRRKARVVLTDADIPRARTEPEPPPAEEAAESEVEGAEEAGTVGSELVVLSWESVESPAGDGLQIYGTVQNQGRGVLTDLGLRVRLYDADGLLIGSSEAQLVGPALPSRARSNFTVGFPGVFAYSSAGFDPHYSGYELRRVPVDDGAIAGGESMAGM